MKNIQLTDSETKLLLMILKESCDFRSDMVCNDPDKNEENLFTEDERKQISSVIGYDEELNDSINKIQEQLLKLQEVGTKLQETFNNIDLND